MEIGELLTTWNGWITFSPGDVRLIFYHLSVERFDLLPPLTLLFPASFYQNQKK